MKQESESGVSKESLTLQQRAPLQSHSRKGDEENERIDRIWQTWKHGQHKTFNGEEPGGRGHTGR